MHPKKKNQTKKNEGTGSGVRERARRSPLRATTHDCEGLMKSLRSPNFTAPENPAMTIQRARATDECERERKSTYFSLVGSM